MLKSTCAKPRPRINATNTNRCSPQNVARLMLANESPTTMLTICALVVVVLHISAPLKDDAR